MSLDNVNAAAGCSMVSIIQVSRTWRSVNMIQYKRLAFSRQQFIKHYYIYISGIYAAVDFSYHMKYSGNGTIGHSENNTFLRYEDKSCHTKLNNRLADFFRRWLRLMAL